jgi:hypothetical protein
MVRLLFFLCIGLASFVYRSTAEDDYMTYDMTPDSGPEQTTVYQPGTPGSSWTDEEVTSTRRRVLQMITPEWDVKKSMHNHDPSDTTKVNLVYEFI